MNKLREEVLLKIEEMGLLLSKELRDRVAEERALRKQTLADFDLKIREFIKSVSSSQSSMLTKLSRKVTQLAKGAETSEQGWKQGIGSLANVIRSLQPALDKEIQTRTANESKMNRKLEESMTAIATEVEQVTEKAFAQIEDLGSRVDTMSKRMEELVGRQAAFEAAVGASIERAKMDVLKQVISITEEEKKKREAFEKEFREIHLQNQLQAQKMGGQLDSLGASAEQDREAQQEGLRQASAQQNEALQKLKDLTAEAMKRQEEERDKRLSESETTLKSFMNEKYTKAEDMAKQMNYYQSELNEKGDWIERAERNWQSRLEEEGDLRRGDYKQLEVYLTTRIKEVAGDVKVLLDAMEPQQVVNNKVSETEQLTGTMKKQIRELWQSLEGVRNEFGEFSQEQKMVLGFLDTQQKTKFGILQKDVSNLLTLYGTSSTQ
mmetsp:Transcript_9711/g.23920  ORF Transcript_9711/g.23920 Transcript_9711/m.23920 type:complete len:436 (-) Transcript_9711:199-1506(-)